MHVSSSHRCHDDDARQLSYDNRLGRAKNGRVAGTVLAKTAMRIRHPLPPVGQATKKMPPPSSPPESTGSRVPCRRVRSRPENNMGGGAGQLRCHRRPEPLGVFPVDVRATYPLLPYSGPRKWTNDAVGGVQVFFTCRAVLHRSRHGTGEGAKSAPPVFASGTAL